MKDLNTTHKEPQALNRLLQATLPNGKLVAQALPLCPEISLFLIDPDFDRGPLPPDVASAVLAEPAYWAFCWASGQAMARVLLDQPQLCQNKTVLDIGSGSGVVAIAAARSGAQKVIACDIDANARAATLANASLNGVSLEITDDLEHIVDRVDLILIADLFYDLANIGLAEQLPDMAREVLIADSRLKSLPVAGYRLHQEMHADTIPDLDESPEFRHVRFYTRDLTTDADTP